MAHTFHHHKPEIGRRWWRRHKPQMIELLTEPEPEPVAPCIVTLFAFTQKLDQRDVPVVADLDLNTGQCRHLRYG